MKRIAILLATAAGLAACGGSSSSPAPYEGFAQPAGTVAVNFTVDDTANKVFLDGELQWKGAMKYDSATRKITQDGTWGGPFAPLYDDGPWDVKNATTGQPGHEPIGSVAGDHKWGVTVFATPPATGNTVIEYGLIDHKFSDGWIWVGSNGSFTLASGGTTPITATGLTLAPHGSMDVRLIIDTAAMTAGFTHSVVKVKGSAWAWNEITLADDGTKGDAAAGDGKYTFVLSEYVGVGKPLSHSGLTKSGDKPEFVFVFDGIEYKDSNSAADPTGVTAATKASTAATWTDAAIAILATNKNTYITVP